MKVRCQIDVDPLRPKLFNFKGQLFVEIGPDTLAHVEPFATFMARTPEEKTRALQLAVAKVQRPSKTIH